MDDSFVEPEEPGPVPVLRPSVEPPRITTSSVVVIALLFAASTGLVALLFYTAHQLIHFTE